MPLRTAFIFPGQGSQAVGMLCDLAQQFPSVVDTFAEASSVLGYDLWNVVQNDPDKILNQTIHTQPALLTASVAIWRVWREKNEKPPLFMAGHSLGEYSALVCAETLDFKSAVKLVADRGRFMQEAVPEGQGAMLAIVGLDNEKIQKICQIAAQGAVIAPANFNAIGQTVIAGNVGAIERAIPLAKEAGAKIVKRVEMSVPSHCILMKEAAEHLAEQLAKITLHIPKIPVVNNVDVAIEQNPEKIKDALVRQLYNPVCWVEVIQFFAKQQIELFVECGPGKVLAGLNKRIVDTPTLSMNDPASLLEVLKR